MAPHSNQHPNIVRISLGAERDLAAIYRRRSLQRGEGGPDGADALLDTLVEAMESLGTFAGRGPVVHELDAIGIRDYRQISVSPYRIIYHVEDSTVTVLLVADSRRDFHTLLNERLLRS
ncbi:type II toxin-antitoxin system RelE/ParE family toxin [Erythrobacter sp.]|uniref:type II toxin-antitoxin system RelE/ParE family toxin n=1 Tax=Erythrobacter sp. TaxID=1042 RepID=UPI00311E30D8